MRNRSEKGKWFWLVKKNFIWINFPGKCQFLTRCGKSKNFYICNYNWGSGSWEIWEVFKTFCRVLHFLLICLLKTHSLNWIKEEKSQGKNLIFLMFGGSNQYFLNFGRSVALRVCIHNWWVDTGFSTILPNYQMFLCFLNINEHRKIVLKFLNLHRDFPKIIAFDFMDGIFTISKLNLSQLLVANQCKVETERLTLTCALHSIWYFDETLRFSHSRICG